MVVPYEHTNRIENLSPEQLFEMTSLIQRGVSCLQRLYCPQGFNVGLNIGDAGGAGIKEHMHWHIIPRWIGDANFVTVIGKTAFAESSKVYEKIREAWLKNKRFAGIARRVRLTREISSTRIAWLKNKKSVSFQKRRLILPFVLFNF